MDEKYDVLGARHEQMSVGLTEEDYGIVKDAAFMEDKTVEDFIIDAALERAGKVLTTKAARKELNNV